MPGIADRELIDIPEGGVGVKGRLECSTGHITMHGLGHWVSKG